MRVSIVAFLFTFTLAFASDLLVDEEVAATDGAVVEELDLDELLEEADQDIPASAVEDVIADEDELATDSAEEIPTESVEEVAAEEEAASTDGEATSEQPIEQSGPFVDLLGHQLYSLEMIDETQAQLVPQYTNDALKGKKVVGLYFSGMQASTYRCINFS